MPFKICGFRIGIRRGLLLGRLNAYYTRRDARMLNECGMRLNESGHDDTAMRLSLLREIQLVWCSSSSSSVCVW